MPELPEVETIRRGLSTNILHKKITGIEILWPGVIKNTNIEFKQVLKNNSFKKINRIGKLLIFVLSKKDKYLLVHLKMTGQLIYLSASQIIAGGHKLSDSDLQVPNKHTRLIIKFSKSLSLYFNDLRKFGYLKIVDEQTLIKVKSQFGVEPLNKDFSLKKFKELLANRKTNLKALLLNQKLVAGIGNIYVDEICYAAKVKPSRKVISLANSEITKLHYYSKVILQRAIKHGGTTFRNYTDHTGQSGNFTNYLQVYGRVGQKCRRCKTSLIKKIKLAGRGTHYCPKCQK